MAIVKGQNLRIFIGNGDSKPLAAALSCDVSIQLGVKQYSTKDDESDFTRNQVVNLSWSLRAQNAVTNDAEVDALGASDLMALIGTVVHVQLATAGGEKNREQDGILLAGYAILSDVQISAENRKRGTFDVTLTGCKNLINEIRRLRTSQRHYLKTADGHILAAPHEA